MEEKAGASLIGDSGELEGEVEIGRRRIQTTAASRINGLK
jgi:hypothetical protein